ncbi:hypothetical protein FOTG_18323 [Fusarium oxysporum f. sp. vasinfectum 25433]|uniref:Zn(2)-C6 fungal-type domain-containing protein n=1 Tax=Fusarium oxysporum f. sp. vasinfectum 25433 TaxID=1089449 RepID=X0KX11_FUSOX|nr:hypothetical protein FOTG_18323 [Fusarium oxysporum f. sp. vasinfectum 25433]
MRQVACLSCRRRKSRCKKQSASDTSCLMCLSHNTPCEFPQVRRPSRRNRDPISVRNSLFEGQSREVNAGHAAATMTSSGPPLAIDTAPPNGCRSGLTPLDVRIDEAQSLNPSPDSNSNCRVLGPILESDSRIAVDCFPRSLCDHRIIKSDRISSIAALPLNPPVFARARRRPAGLDNLLNPAQTNLQLLEKFLQPHCSILVEMFVTDIHPCFPILDPTTLRQNLSNPESDSQVSPALLCCSYASTLTFWKTNPVLSKERLPDQRFIWNLANEALFSELRLCPSIHTIAAILFNVGGRPSTLPFNNTGQLGFAVSIAFSMGLNRDPSAWDIPEEEKNLRKRIWTSFSCGTPPRIQAYQNTLPPPDLKSLSMIESPKQCKAEIYTALFSLTEILSYYLDVTQRSQKSSSDTVLLENRVDAWSESTTGRIRRIILRGLEMDTPGASNLRLAFLSVQFLHCRISLEVSRAVVDEISCDQFRHEYFAGRRAAEDIIVYLQELSSQQLQCFWMPELSSTFCFVTSFLFRGAIEWELAWSEPSENSALSLLRTLINMLRTHKQDNDWDIGDNCLEQFSELLDSGNVLDMSIGFGDIDFDELAILLAEDGPQETTMFPFASDS